MVYWMWLIIFVIFAALELFSMGLTSIWFAIGALAACVTSLFETHWILQVIVFIVVTTAVIIFIRPFAVKHLNNKAEKTNVDSMTGKTGKVLVEIDNIAAKGQIVVDGMEWTARSEDGTILEKDSIVTVVKIEGVKAIVKKA